MIRRLAEMTWREVERLEAAQCLVFLPISPLEQHGPHLPLGMDLYGAEYLTLQMAELFQALYEDWDVLLVPGIPVGCNAFDYPGSLFTRQRLVRDLLVDYGACLARHGLKHLVLVSVHGGTGHIIALEEAAGILNRRFKCRVISPLGALATKFFSGGYEEELSAWNGAPLSDEQRRQLRSDWHAGWWETSLMMLARPDLVRPFGDLPDVIVDDYRKINDALIRQLNDGEGYLGAPAQASASFGKLLTGLFIVDAVRLIDRIIIQGDSVRSDDRSPLYDIPFLRTDFVRNSVALGAGVLLTLLGVEAVRKRKPPPALPESEEDA